MRYSKKLTFQFAIVYFRVIGIEGLRVVDASVMPAVTDANTHAAVYGIAEKASHMILRDWERRI